MAETDGSGGMTKDHWPLEYFQSAGPLFREEVAKNPEAKHVAVEMQEMDFTSEPKDALTAGSGANCAVQEFPASFQNVACPMPGTNSPVSPPAKQAPTAGHETLSRYPEAETPKGDGACRAATEGSTPDGWPVAPALLAVGPPPEFTARTRAAPRTKRQVGNFLTVTPDSTSGFVLHYDSNPKSHRCE